MPNKKEVTFGVRIEATLSRKLDTLSGFFRGQKGSLIRACLEKLCADNKVLIDYPDLAGQYSFIRTELSKLPEDLVVVRNGSSWNDVKDSTMSLLCSEFWRTSITVFSFWKELVEKYDALSDAFREYLGDNENAEKWETHTRFWLEAPPIQDMGELLEEKYWLDSSAALKVTLSYATRKAIEESFAEKIVRELLKTEEIVKKRKPLRLVINARGGIRLRAQVEGKDYLSAVYTEGAEH